MRPSVRILALFLSAALLPAGCGTSGGSPGSSPAGQRSGTTTGAPGAGQGAKAPPGSRGRAVPALIPPPGAPPQAVHVPVLTYHRVAPLSATGILDLKVDPANFDAELAALNAHGYHTITQAQLFDALYRRGTLPPHPVLITVDDGYVEDITRILPALQRFHMVASFFVITGRMTEPGFLTADQIRELDRAGMDIGDHTAHHVDLRLLTPSQLRLETAGSRQALEHVLGHPVYTFAYPFGSYNGSVVAAVRAAGFTLAYTTAGGTSERTTGPLTLPRIHVGRSETPPGLLSELGAA